MNRQKVALMTVAGNNEKKNGVLGTKLDWPTVVLILVTGGGNFLATNKAEHSNTVEMERARSEVHQIHGSLDDFEKYMRQSFDNQNQILANQTRMLEGQNQILAELKAVHR